MESPKLNVLRTAQDIEVLQAYLKDFDYISYDCETTGLLRTDQVVGVSFCAEESQAFYIVLSEWNKEEGRLVDLGHYDRVKGLLESLKGKKLIMHNSIFDCSMAEFFFKTRLIDSLHTDTMVLAHLLNENRKVGLKELGKEYFGASAANEQAEMKASVEANGGMITKSAYEMYKADSGILGKYGAQDAMLTYKLFYVLLEELFEEGLDKFFYEDESMLLLRGPTYELNTTGIKVDREQLITLKQTLQSECVEAKAFVYQEIDKHIKDKYPGDKAKNKFNIGSSSQLAWLMFGKLELEFGVLTDGGKEVCKAMGLKLPYTAAAKRDFIASCLRHAGYVYQHEAVVNGKTVRAKKIKEPWNYIKCDKTILTKYSTRYEWVKRLLEYQRKTKILTTYVEGFEERMLYGTLNPGFLQHGTTSGRYASRNPNFQNLPRDDKRVKACMIPRPGKVFVGADYSQLEPRVFAYFSQDTELMKSFKEGKDFYSVIGMRVYDITDAIPFKDDTPGSFPVKYKKERDATKGYSLAATYGGTENRLSAIIGKSIEQTREDIVKYFETFPGVHKFMMDCHDYAKTNGHISNLFGRKRRLPDAKRISKAAKHGDLPYEQRTVLNLSVNHRVQSTGASIVNRSAIKIHELKQQLDMKAKLIVQVHDSLIYECDEGEEAENMAIIMQEAMENTIVLDGVGLQATPLIGNNLSKV